MATGKVIGVNRQGRTTTGITRISVDVPSEQVTTLSVDDVIEIRKTLSDEELGQKLRMIFTPTEKEDSSAFRNSVLELAENIENSYGWPVLADLLRDLT